MAIPVPYAFSGASRLGRCACAPIALVAIALCGWSIPLGSLSPSTEREEPPQLTSSSNIASLTETIKKNPNDPQAYNMRGSVLAQAGKTEEALADFNKAIDLDPNYGQAFANRGLIYRKTKRLDQAMSDYERDLALDPGYPRAWLGGGVVYKGRTRGLRYERLGDKTKAAGSYGRAINLRPKDEAARSGFARVGGKPGQTYETF